MQNPSKYCTAESLYKDLSKFFRELDKNPGLTVDWGAADGIIKIRDYKGHTLNFTVPAVEVTK